jgi:hypothetical protein
MGNHESKWNKSLTPEEHEALFLSPEFSQRYAANFIPVLLSEDIRDEFWENLTQQEVDRYIEQGRAMREKRKRDLGY